MVKVLSYFESYNKGFTSEIFFVFVKSYSILHGCQRKSFIPVFFKVSIDHLFDNLESEKVNYCFGKGLEKVLNFG